ncbi:MAG: hypothetical protein RIB58_00960 [Phycisphaerales bacterium]|jgi:hypothetical protein
MRFWPRRRLPKVKTGDDGVSLVDGKDFTTFEWRSVVRIEAFKIDLYTVDCIAIEFTLDDGVRVCMHEDFEGFTSLVKEIERVFDGIPDEWWTTVAFPAFEENRTLLWARPPK